MAAGWSRMLLVMKKTLLLVSPIWKGLDLVCSLCMRPSRGRCLTVEGRSGFRVGVQDGKAVDDAGLQYAAGDIVRPDVQYLRVERNGSFNLTCRAQANTLRNYRWVYIRDGTRRPQVLSSGRRLVVADPRFSLTIQLESESESELLEEHDSTADQEKSQMVKLVLRMRNIEPMEAGLFVCWRQGLKPDPQVLVTVTEPGAPTHDPVIEEVMGPSQVQTGSPFQLTCVVLHADQHQVKWTVDGKKVTGKRRRYSLTEMRQEDGTLHAHLHVTKLRKDAEFVCALPDLEDVEPVAHKVIVMVPKVESLTAEPSVDRVHYGQTLLLTCTVSSTDSEVVWLKDGEELMVDDTLPGVQRFSRSEGDNRITSSVYIESLAPVHNGQYVCYVPGASRNILVNLESRPAQVLGVDGNDFEEGELLRLSCQTQYDKEKEPVTWSSESFQTTDEVYRELLHEAYNITTHQLLIPNAQSRHAGTYTCSTSFGQASVTVRYIEPPRVVVSSVVEHVTEGEAVEVECRAQGQPIPEIEWFFLEAAEGTEIRVAAVHIPGVMLEDVGVQGYDEAAKSLRIPRARANHTATYACVATNHLGEAEALTLIHVEPIPPEVVSLVTTEAMEGGNLTISCTTSHWDMPVVWLHNKELVHHHSMPRLGFSMREGEGYPVGTPEMFRAEEREWLVRDPLFRLHELTITGVRLEDGGRYECNVDEYVFSNIDVNVTEVLLTATWYEDADGVVLVCTVRGPQVSQVSWLDEQWQPLEGKPHLERLEPTVTQHYLRLHPAQPAGPASASCVLKGTLQLVEVLFTVPTKRPDLDEYPYDLEGDKRKEEDALEELFSEEEAAVDQYYDVQDVDQQEEVVGVVVKEEKEMVDRFEEEEEVRGNELEYGGETDSTASAGDDEGDTWWSDTVETTRAPDPTEEEHRKENDYSWPGYGSIGETKESEKEERNEDPAEQDGNEYGVGGGDGDVIGENEEPNQIPGASDGDGFDYYDEFGDEDLLKEFEEFDDDLDDDFFEEEELFDEDELPGGAEEMETPSTIEEERLDTGEDEGQRLWGPNGLDNVSNDTAEGEELAYTSTEIPYVNSSTLAPGQAETPGTSPDPFDEYIEEDYWEDYEEKEEEEKIMKDKVKESELQVPVMGVEEENATQSGKLLEMLDGTVEMEEGDDLFLTCIVSPLLQQNKAEVRFSLGELILTKGNNVMAPDPRISVHATLGLDGSPLLQLRLQSVTPNDRGIYYCRTDDFGGEHVFDTTNVEVIGLAAEPEPTAADIDDTSSYEYYDNWTTFSVPMTTTITTSSTAGLPTQTTTESPVMTSSSSSTVVPTMTTYQTVMPSTSESSTSTAFPTSSSPTTTTMTWTPETSPASELPPPDEGEEDYSTEDLDEYDDVTLPACTGLDDDHCRKEKDRESNLIEDGDKLPGGMEDYVIEDTGKRVEEVMPKEESVHIIMKSDEDVILSCTYNDSIDEVSWKAGDLLLFLGQLNLGGISGLYVDNLGALVVEPKVLAKSSLQEYSFTCFRFDIDTFTEKQVASYQLIIDGKGGATKHSPTFTSPTLTQLKPATPNFTVPMQKHASVLKGLAGMAVTLVTNTDRLKERLETLLQEHEVTVRSVEMAEGECGHSKQTQSWLAAQKAVKECEFNARVSDDESVEMILVAVDFFVEMMHNKWYSCSTLYLHDLLHGINAQVFTPVLPLPYEAVVSPTQESSWSSLLLNDPVHTIQVDPSWQSQMEGQGQCEDTLLSTLSALDRIYLSHRGGTWV